MCGIVGYIDWSGKPVRNTEVALRMLNVQKHRGPDDSGVRAFSLKAGTSREYSNQIPEEVDVTFEGIVGFNRLSIIDLSLNGHQPMCTNDGKVILVFNGEIYNAFDYKSELESDGYRFKSSSDTEVIIALYLRYGFDGMITRLNGMFAIVLIDLHVRSLFMARDRFGIKPMYFYESGSRMAFASEIKSLTALPGFTSELNRNLLDEFLIFRNNVNNTLFKGLVGVEPGCYRVYSEGRVKVIRYFSINAYTRDEGPKKWAETLSLLKENIKASVAKQLISDVKVGCQLSGGIDSSLVTYYAGAAKHGDALETISIVFNNKSFSEEPYVDQVTRLTGNKAHKFTLDAGYYLDNFQRATVHFEAPLNHPNTIGIYFLSEQARKHVTVLLSGEGADEVYGGYSRFASLIHPYQPSTYLSALRMNYLEGLNHVLAYQSGATRSIMGAAYMTPSIAKRLFPDFCNTRASGERRSVFESLSGSVFDRQVKYEMLTYLPDLLLRQDKMSMAHSIENRVPFLDNDLVEKSFQIPVEHLIGKSPHGEHSKLALKKVASDVYGDAFAFRSKEGFGIPLREFFSNPLFLEYLKTEIVPSIASRGIFNVKPVAKWSDNLKNITSRELDALWIMIAFEVWAIQFNIRS